MVNSNKDDFGGDGKINGSVHENQTDDEVVEESSVDVESSSISQGESSAGIVDCLSDRLTSILVNEGDGDLLLQQSDQENNVLQWLEALDLQVIGACRADERLKPLLKLKVSNGAAEDRLLDNLSQHFEVPEVGMLARCLCIPLVSVRVGKVIKQGTHLCPTAIRGRLNLTLLPSSDLRISFVGDDGCIEILATLSSNSDSLAVEIEKIPADKSGRSFLLKFQSGEISYFWCSEQSIPFGFELLAKMKDLLSRKPSLAQLTGISESRLGCFANHLRAYVLGYVESNLQANLTESSVSLLDTPPGPQWDSNMQFSSSMSKSSRSRQIGGQAVKPHSFCQGSLSPRSNPFKDGVPRNFSTVRSGPRERFRRRGDNHCNISGIDSLLVASTHMTELFNTSQTRHNKHPEINDSRPLFPLSFLELGDNVLLPSSNLSSSSLSFPQVPRTGSIVSPYSCWCPPCTSNLQYTVTPLHLPVSLTEAPSLPSLSSLLSAAKSSSSLVPRNPTLNLLNVPSLGFPALPDPVVRVPLSVSSFIAISSSHQFPTFTPLICDPIVHIPIINVCSSGDQGYLVSAGPSISTTISPLHPNIVNQLIPETESLVEKGARETLRLLLGSSQRNPQMMEVLPAVITSSDEKQNNIVLGSRGLYCGTRDVSTIVNSVATVGLVSLPDKAIGDDVPKGHRSDNDDDYEGNQSTGSESLGRS